MALNLDPGTGPNKSKNKLRPLYLSWRLWLIISLVLLLVGFIVLAVVGTDALSGVITAGVAWVTGTGVWGLVVKYVWPPLWEEIKAQKERTDTNTEDITFLRKSYEALGRQYLNINKMYEMVVNDLQQERAESKSITTELRAQINDLIKQNQFQQAEIDRQKKAHQEEIVKLTEQIRLMGVEKNSDKETIIKLQTQVEQLHKRVKELEEWGSNLADRNKRLEEEKLELKANFGRRSTDKLTGLSPEAEARYNKLELDREKGENQ